MTMQTLNQMETRITELVAMRNASPNGLSGSLDNELDGLRYRYDDACDEAGKCTVLGCPTITPDHAQCEQHRL